MRTLCGLLILIAGCSRTATTKPVTTAVSAASASAPAETRVRYAAGSPVAAPPAAWQLDVGSQSFTLVRRSTSDNPPVWIYQGAYGQYALSYNRFGSMDIGGGNAYKINYAGLPIAPISNCSYNSGAIGPPYFQLTPIP